MPTAAMEADAGATVVDAKPAPLPPPKPVTLPLATHSGDPIDEAIAAGDDAFEAGDMAAAQKQYQTAHDKAPKRAAPIVGVARVGVAKVGAPMDFGAAKGNHAIRVATDLLRKAIKLDPAFGPAYVELGRALLLLGDADAALETLRRRAWSSSRQGRGPLRAWRRAPRHRARA